MPPVFLEYPHTPTHTHTHPRAAHSLLRMFPFLKPPKKSTRYPPRSQGFPASPPPPPPPLQSPRTTTHHLILATHLHNTPHPPHTPLKTPESSACLCTAKNKSSTHTHTHSLSLSSHSSIFTKQNKIKCQQQPHPNTRAQHRRADRLRRVGGWVGQATHRRRGVEV